jgi:hypothetical protein
MKARVQLGLLRLADPRVIRAVLLGLMVAAMVLAQGSVAHADPCPGGSGGGCGGG